jgi:S1-C subfamily serine protease
MEERHEMQSTRPDRRPTGATRRTRVRLRLFALSLAAVLAVLAAIGMARAETATVGNGIVVVDTTLGYEDGEAAGTGMVLTANGKILTNNHVIEGATAIRVVVPETGRSYSARVVGYSVKNDVAVLKLTNATNLATVTVASGTKLRLGQTVRATGNARGTGNLSTVTGTITGLAKTITASDGQGNAEQLTGLIETNAAVVSGDSGGPLENGSGRVIGMVTAASASGGFRFRDVSANRAYAIPIRRALSVVHTVDAGTSTASVHVGPTAFLGVSVTSAGGTGYGGDVGSGAAVVGVASGSPAARAGLQRGDVIVSVDGKAVKTPSALRSRILVARPGQKVKLVYLDDFGTRTTVSVALTSGPPQ